jgi:ATP-binding cassette subfamily B (MDR/TAP) protein 1
MIEMSQFFRYMGRRDRFLMFMGTVSALIAGFLLPSISLAVGAVTNSYDPRNAKEELLNTMKSVSLYICLVGLGTWLFGYIYYGFWQHLAQNVSFDLRSRYLHAILRQEVAYFEKANVEQLPSQIGENFAIVTEGIGEKYSNVIFSMAALASGLGIAFYRGADFAAVCAGFLPCILLIMIVFGAQMKKSAINKMIVMKKVFG